jgi:hypothetical protein
MNTEKQQPNSLSASLTEEIRELYVQGVSDNAGNRVYPSIETLASDFNVAKVTLFRRAKSQDWRTQRAIFEQRLSQEKDSKRLETLIKESVEFDSRNLNLAKAMQGQVTHLIRLAAQEIQDNDLRRPFTPVGLERLANAVIAIQKVGKLALGETTENTSINATVSNESAIREVHEFLDELTEIKRNGGKSLH